MARLGHARRETSSCSIATSGLQKSYEKLLQQTGVGKELQNRRIGVKEEIGQPLGAFGQAKRDMGRTIQISKGLPGRSLYTRSTIRETDTSNMECAQPTPLIFVKQLANGITKIGGATPGPPA